MRRAMTTAAVLAGALALCASLAACGRGDSDSANETVEAPNMVVVAPEAPANVVAPRVIKPAATEVSTGGGGDPTQIEEDAAATGMTSRPGSVRTTTTMTTTTHSTSSENS